MFFSRRVTKMEKEGTNGAHHRTPYDTLPISPYRGFIGRRPSVLRAFASVVGIFAVSTLAYRVVVPLESTSVEPWLSLKSGTFHNAKLYQERTHFNIESLSPADQNSEQRTVKVNPIVRKLMRAAANRVRSIWRPN